MATPPVPDDLLRQIASVYSPDKTVKELADKLGWEWTTTKRRLRLAAEKGMLGYGPPLEGFSISRISTTIKADGSVRSQSIRQRPEDGPEFEIPSGHVIRGVSTLVGPNGRTVQQWVKTKQETVVDVDTIKAAIEAALAAWQPRSPLIDGPETDEDKQLTIYPIADVHLGLRACADACGTESNLDLATAKFRRVTRRLLAQSPDSGTALILQLGDWTHADDDLAMTPTSKHILQVSDDILPVIERGIELMVDLIYQALEKHTKVIVKILPGNHDKNAWIGLYVALVQHFRDNNRVTIDRQQADYWFFRWGSTLIGAHHGHRLRPEEMAAAMANECRADWGETFYHLFLHGHLHHERVKEVMGVSVECFRTMADVDRHHSGKYGSGKSLISITLHEDDGPDGRSFVNLPPALRRAVQGRTA